MSISPCSRSGRDLDASGNESASVSDPSLPLEPSAIAPHTRPPSFQKMKPPTPTKKEIASESVMLPFCASSAMRGWSRREAVPTRAP